MVKESNIKSSRFIHRDLSWLDFNYRVLQEAKDPNVPLFERIKFLAIYSSNLDEFFRVRVANHRNLLRVGKKTMR
ncbi:MAG: polyphosphate kinase 1, partial [Saprospiraceae bacterium]